MMGYSMMDGDYSMWGWSGMVFGPLMMIAFLVLIVMFIKWTIGSGDGISKSNDALNILNERFAAGDIDRNEFEEKRNILS